jgi:hypothetical protein
VALGDGDRGAARAGLKTIRAVDGKEVPSERGCPTLFWRPTTGLRRPSRFVQG